MKHITHFEKEAFVKSDMSKMNFLSTIFYSSKSIFFLLGFQYNELDRMKTCYAFDMPGNEFLPDEIEAGVKNVSLIFFLC